MLPTMGALWTLIAIVSEAWNDGFILLPAISKLPMGLVSRRFWMGD
jgi:hypothetical protein